MQTKDLFADIIISGAGPAGSTLAALLGRAGLKTVLVDAEPPELLKDSPPASGRTAALLTGSINILKAAGIWDIVAPHAMPLKIMKIVDGDLSAGVTFKASEIGHDSFGYNIPNAFLRSALAQSIQKTATITRLSPARVIGYVLERGNVQASLEDGRTIRGTLIVGTDGRNSIVRKVAGIGAKNHNYGQTAMTCLIEHTKPHHSTSTEFHRSGGPFTLVPMPGNMSSVVWVEKTDDAKRFLLMKKADFQQEVQDRSHGFVGTITLKSNPESWPLTMLSCQTLIAPRAALAAEAAHVLSPIGAQGLNLSLRDVATLAETLVDAARLGEDVGSATVLSRYEKRRRADIHAHVLGIDGLNRAVANDLAFLQDLRRLGLKGLDNIPTLKNFAMHQGLAPTMDEGRLLRGAGL